MSLEGVVLGHRQIVFLGFRWLIPGPLRRLINGPLQDVRKCSKMWTSSCPTRVDLELPHSSFGYHVSPLFVVFHVDQEASLLPLSSVIVVDLHLALQIYAVGSITWPYFGHFRVNNLAMVGSITWPSFLSL